MKLPFKLDAWQEEVLAAEGNLCICSGRQVGKSQIVAIKAAEYIALHPGKGVLIVSVTEDQAELMIQKILLYLEDNHPKLICKGKNRPTKHMVKLRNRSNVRTKAVGQTGVGMRGFTVDVFVPDEAAYMPEAIWPASTPILLTTGGVTWMLSTPNAMKGYFYEAYTDPKLGFQTFHVNSEEVAQARPEPMRSHMLHHLELERARMTKLQYAQQYLAQFLEELGQFFPDSLINACQVLERTSINTPYKSPAFNSSQGLGEFYLGVDVARMGGDESTFEVLEEVKDVYFHRENLMRKYTLTTDTTDEVIRLDTLYDFNTIFIDDGGLGVAVFDQLLHEDQTKRKVVPINNARRALDRDETRKKKLLKEDLYMNLKRLMERGEIKLLKDSEVFTSLKSVVIEHTERSGEVRIHGRYTHIVEGLIRAAWSVRCKHLNIYFERG